jgi:hypothetical protein
VLGDADGDLDIDLADYAQFSNCFSGDFLAGPQACAIFDFAAGLPIGSADYAMFSCGWVGPDAVVDAVTVDPSASPTANTQITLSGTIAGAAQIQVTGGAQTVVAATDDCEFSIQVPLRANALNRLYVTGLFNGGGMSAPTAVAVTQD